jgi:hypothetical protein
VTAATPYLLGILAVYVVLAPWLLAVYGLLLASAPVLVDLHPPGVGWLDGWADLTRRPLTLWGVVVWVAALLVGTAAAWSRSRFAGGRTGVVSWLVLAGTGAALAIGATA